MCVFDVENGMLRLVWTWVLKSHLKVFVFVFVFFMCVIKIVWVFGISKGLVGSETLK